MDALVDLIKRIGIFMIAAQAVIHFSPEQKYGKYMKLIVSIMILLQFLTPIYGIFTGLEAEWDESLFDISEDYTAEEMPGTESAEDALVDSMEKEIKSRLNDEIAQENYRVVGVRVSLETLRERDENGFRQYALNNVRVVVMLHSSVAADDADTEKGTSGDEENKEGNDKESGGGEGIEKIQIQKINVGTEQEGEEEGRNIAEGYGQIADELRIRFAQALGIEEAYMEVSVYGTVEESAE